MRCLTRRDETRRGRRSPRRGDGASSAFPISLNSTSKHIRILERAGLVTRTLQGREHVLSLNAAPMAEAAEWMAFYRRFWKDRLAALEDFVIQKRSKAKPKAKQ